jgi:glutathione synthase/RimK-type ligase-like ATP-grasp enzyme
VSDDAVVGIGTDPTGWYEDVVEAFANERSEGAPVQTRLVDLSGHDWAQCARGFDALVWNPQFMGAVSASLFKEKIYFLEHVAGLRIMPNYASVWHFESKVAQSYLLEALDIPRPRTVVSFEYEDARAAAKGLGIPLVAKRSHGASSENVVLLRTQAEVDRYLERAFAQQIWDARKRKSGSPLRAAASGPLSAWFGEKVRRATLGEERHDYAYFQEFVPGNDSDLRINVIGRRVDGCRRKNRPNDFRASGSGEYIRCYDLPADAVALCMETRERIGADSLAIDLLYRDGEPLIVEMSFAESVSSHPVHWVKESDGSYTRVDGEVSDQVLWAKHILDELGL